MFYQAHLILLIKVNTMKRITTTVLFLFLIATISIAQIKIMPLGNSITYGNNIGDLTLPRPLADRITYRKDLFDLLTLGGYSFDFVGSETSGTPTVTDGDNAGFPGVTASQLESLLNTGVLDQAPSSPGGLAGHSNGDIITAGFYLDAFSPDAILLHIGTNDVGTTTSTHIADILDEVDAYESRVGKTVPVFLALIIKNDPNDPATQTLNAAVQTMASTRILGGDEIVVVDMENGAGINYATDMVDQYHPNITGYSKMADLWYSEFSAYFIDPTITSTAITTATVGDAYVYDVQATGSSLVITYSITSPHPPSISIDGNTGVISWTPVEGEVGTQAITVKAEDAVGSDTQSFTITIGIDNAAPIFTMGANQSVDEDSGAQTITNWATGIDDGDPELTQTVTFNVVSNTNAALFSAQPVISSTGTLTYTPVANENGSATIEIELNDGLISSATQSFTITVNAINDVPTFTNGANQMKDEDAGAQTIVGWVIAMDDGDSDVNQALSFNIVSNSNAALFSTSPAISNIGTLTYTSAANAFGSATINVTISDNGSGVAPNQNTSAQQSFIITINGVNDAPSVTTSAGNTNFIEGSGAVAVDNSIVVQDVDDTNLVSATVTISNNFISGEDVLNFNNLGTGISGVYAAGVLSLSGNTSKNNYQNVLRTVTYNNTSATPDVNNRTITFIVNDGDDDSNIASKTVLINDVNTAPQLTNSGVNDVTVNEDAPNNTINLFDSFQDVEDADADMIYTVESISNPALFSTTSVNATNGNLVLDFAPNKFGTSNITVRCKDTGGLFVESTFLVTVNAVNDTPTTSGVSNVLVNEDAANSNIGLFLSFADIEDTDANLVYVVQSNSNSSLFTTTNISGATGVLTLNYAPDKNGVATIVIKATDTGGKLITTSFTVTISAINDEPTLNNISNPTAINEESPQKTINLSGITAGPNEAQTLAVTATSSNPALLEIISVNYASPQSTGSIIYKPKPNAFGTAIVTVVVSDNGSAILPNDNKITKTFSVTINPVNDAPEIDPILPELTIFINAGQQCVDLTGISAGPLESDNIIISASSSNPVLIPNNASSLKVFYTSPNATGQLCFTPAPGQTGQSTITLTVIDTGSPAKSVVKTFNVIVKAVNAEPTMNVITDQIIDEDEVASLTIMGISAGISESQVLSFDLFSDNKAILDENDLSLTLDYTQGDATAVLNFTPKEDMSGVINITVTLTDDGPGALPHDNEIIKIFQVTVNPINDVPTVDEIMDQGIFAVNETPPTIMLTGISDGAVNETQNLTISATSDNQSLVTNGNINISYTAGAATGTLSYTLVPGAEGETNITVTVTDDGATGTPNVNSFSRTFKVTVSKNPDLVITTIQLSNNDVSRGQNIIVTSTVKNEGNSTADNVILSYFFSANDTFEDGLDDLLGTKMIGSVNAGAEDDWVSDALKIPASILPSIYYIIVVADKSDNIVELDETNNSFFKPITVNNNQPPQINFVVGNPTVLEGDNTSLTFIVEASDDTALPGDPVTLFYRGISSATDFIEKTAEEGDKVNEYKYKLDRSFITKDSIGIEYRFEVKDATGSTFSTNLSHVYIKHKNTRIEFKLNYGKEKTDYQMVSVPLNLDESGIASVFEDNFGGYDNENWRMFTYENSTNKGFKEYKDGLTNITPGKAYWLIVRDEPGEDKKNIDVGEGVTVTVTKENPFQITLNEGWNQIGNPYNFNVSWQDVLDFNENPDDVVISETLKRYTNSANKSGYEDLDVLPRLSGAFVHVDKNITLKIPVIRNSTVANGRTGSGGGNTAFDNENWQVSIDLFSGNTYSKINGFGMHKDARDSKDKYDSPALPTNNFTGDLSLRFNHSGNENILYSRDIVSTKENYMWEFDLAASVEGENVELKWSDLQNAFPNKNLMLYDEGIEEVVDMKIASSYRVSRSNVSRFKIYYGDDAFIKEHLKPARVFLGQSFPNPFTYKTTIPFSLTDTNQDYEVEINIFNLAGQQVKRIAKRNFSPGFHEIVWNGRDERNSKISSGVYIYKMTVRSGNFSKKLFGRVVLQ